MLAKSAAILARAGLWPPSCQFCQVLSLLVCRDSSRRTPGLGKARRHAIPAEPSADSRARQAARRLLLQSRRKGGSFCIRRQQSIICPELSDGQHSATSSSPSSYPRRASSSLSSIVQRRSSSTLQLMTGTHKRSHISHNAGRLPPQPELTTSPRPAARRPAS